VANRSDQPWKIARMNKFTYALALGAGLVLSLAVPNAQAAPMIQDLTPTTMSATQFSSLYQPIAASPELTSSYSFLNTPNAGVVESQVFAGIQGTAAEGTYAYAYQFGVNSVKDGTGQATSVNSASMYFNATPAVSNFTGTSATSYVVTNGQVGNINVPQALPGSTVQVPSTIAWNPNTTTGSLTFQYLNPATNTGPLAAGALSGTVVMISTQGPMTQPVSIQNPDPQTVYGYAYSPVAGSIAGVPAPEPATILAWGSVLAALALGQRYRRNHTTA
jgi:hypothetical protein